MTENSHTPPDDQPSKPLSNKEHIANLSRMVACFYPVFVNESGEEASYSVAVNPKRSSVWKWNHKFKPRPGVERVPTLDDFLNTCAGAIMGMREFIAEYETARAKLDDVLPKHTALVSDAMMAHRASMEKGVSAPSLAEAIDIWIGRFMQAIDVFKTIYETDISGLSVEGLLHATQRFQKSSHEFAARFIAQGFLKSIGGGLPETPSPLSSPKTDGGGDEGKNPDSGI